jgi:hypothetical protein
METFGEHEIEMTRLARGENSTTGTNYVPTRAELVGGVVGGKETDVVHMRLQRMSAFESHDYDPIDNDLEEDALRGAHAGGLQVGESMEMGDVGDDWGGDGVHCVRGGWIGG